MIGGLGGRSIGALATAQHDSESRVSLLRRVHDFTPFTNFVKHGADGTAPKRLAGRLV